MHLPAALLVDDRHVSDGSALAVDPPERHPEPGLLAEAVGRGLRLLHETPAPSEETSEPTIPVGWTALFERCRQRVESGEAAADERPQPYDRYEPDRLLQMLVDSRPTVEDLVICHGRPGTEAVWVRNGAFAGFTRPTDAIVADRHVDLAVAHESVHHTLGGEAVFAMYDAYGRDPDLIRLDHYILLHHLLGPRPAPTSAVDQTGTSNR